MKEKRVFVIGDVHGHYDRLEALLTQEGLLGPNQRPDCTVVQLGDLGHFGEDGQPSGDVLCWQMAQQGVIDVVLWGNHDRAVVSSRHAFWGYTEPRSEILHIMRLMEAEGRLLMAYAAHGHLITHAGLHAQWKYQSLPDESIRNDPYKVADYINAIARGLSGTKDDSNHAVYDAVGRERGGGSPYGGILWRDYTEKLYRGFPQIFGHSASRRHKVRHVQDSWCIDVGSKGGAPGNPGNCLAGIWLPELRVAEVRL